MKCIMDLHIHLLVAHRHAANVLQKLSIVLLSSAEKAAYYAFEKFP